MLKPPVALPLVSYYLAIQLSNEGSPRHALIKIVT